MKNDTEWLANLKAGDEVAIQRNYFVEIGFVARTTPTLIVVGTERFGRVSGRSTGSTSWSASWLVPPTAEIRESWARRRAIARVRDTEWKALLRRVVAILNERREAQP